MIDKLGELVKKYRRIITYGVVGVINTAVDFLVFTILSTFFTFNIGINQAIGYCAGVACSFLLNRGVTFKRDATTNLPTQIVRFIVTNAVSLLISTLLISALKDAELNDYVAKCIVTPLAMVINYVGYKMFVFMVK